MSVTTVLSQDSEAKAAPARQTAALGAAARLALGLLLPLGLALGWEIAVAAGLASGRLLPPPSRIGAALWTLAASGELWTHVEATLIRVGLGFAFGASAGIHHGIREQIDPGAAIVGNGYEQATEFLPTDWLTALRALEGSTWAREALGEEFLKVFLAIKKTEYRQFMGEVGEQDWRWYLNHA